MQEICPVTLCRLRDELQLLHDNWEKRIIISTQIANVTTYHCNINPNASTCSFITIELANFTQLSLQFFVSALTEYAQKINGQSSGRSPLESSKLKMWPDTRQVGAEEISLRTKSIVIIIIQLGFILLRWQSFLWKLMDVTVSATPKRFSSWSSNSTKLWIVTTTSDFAAIFEPSSTTSNSGVFIFQHLKKKVYIFKYLFIYIYLNHWAAGSKGG